MGKYHAFLTRWSNASSRISMLKFWCQYSPTSFSRSSTSYFINSTIVWKLYLWVRQLSPWLNTQISTSSTSIQCCRARFTTRKTHSPSTSSLQVVDSPSTRIFKSTLTAIRNHTPMEINGSRSTSISVSSWSARISHSDLVMPSIGCITWTSTCQVNHISFWLIHTFWITNYCSSRSKTLSKCTTVQSTPQSTSKNLTLS